MIATQIGGAAVRTDFAGSFKIVGEKPLGSGLTADVWRAQAVSSDIQLAEQEVAVKVYRTNANSAADDSAPEVLRREAELLAEVQGHPNILRFHSLFRLSSEDVPANDSEAVAPSPRWCITTELCGGTDLYTTLSMCSMQESQAKKIMVGILGALAHIHERGVLHRDVKVENVMIRVDGTPVLADFGLSCRTSDMEALKLGCGSAGYIPPEVLLKQGWQEESDVFSAGVMLFVMLARRQPFQGRDVMETLENTVRCKLDLAKHRNLDSLAPECKALLRHLLSRKPEQRPVAEEAMQQAWFVEEAADLPNGFTEKYSRSTRSFSSESSACTTLGGATSTSPCPFLTLVPCPQSENQGQDDEEKHWQEDSQGSEDEILAGAVQLPSRPASWKYLRKLTLIKRAATMSKEGSRHAGKIRSLFGSNVQTSLKLSAVASESFSLVPQPPVQATEAWGADSAASASQQPSAKSSSRVSAWLFNSA